MGVEIAGEKNRLILGRFAKSSVLVGVNTAGLQMEHEGLQSVQLQNLTVQTSIRSPLAELGAAPLTCPSLLLGDRCCEGEMWGKRLVVRKAFRAALALSWTSCSLWHCPVPTEKLGWQPVGSQAPAGSHRAPFWGCS